MVGLLPAPEATPSLWRDGPGADGTGARRADALLGAALVGAFSLVMVIAAVVLQVAVTDLRAVVEVAAVAAAAAVVLAALPSRRLPRWRLLCFPLLLVAAEVALSVVTTGVSAACTAFLTLAFLYLGLTQPRSAGPAFAVLVAPAWVLAQQQWSAGVAVRLVLAVFIWLVLSDVLSVRTARGRMTTEHLIAQANTDVLTGLGSRLLLSDRIEKLSARDGADEADGSALLLVDLDGFKAVNDTYGHAAGDELLVGVARRLRSVLRPGDVAVRVSGDEFAILLRGDIAHAGGIATRVLTSLGEPVALSRGHRVAVTASIGIAGVAPGARGDDVLRDADMAVYEAKQAGRNQVAVFEVSAHDRLRHRLELEAQLRDGLEAGQFEVYFQPVVHMGTGAMVGAEALVRWRHPHRGLLAPGEFLDVSESLGIMDRLGGQVLDQACVRARSWQHVDPDRAFSVAVNVSAPEMFADDLVPRVRATLEHSGLPGSLLVLEITERVIMADATLAARRLAELRRLGVRVALDDFGTGHSSLAYLRDLPIDIVKIDQSFVRPLGTDHQALALLRSIVGIADALTLDLIAEGVETPAQVEILHGLGCQLAQGFYFGRPVSAAEFGAYLQRPSPAGVAPMVP